MMTNPYGSFALLSLLIAGTAVSAQDDSRAHRDDATILRQRVAELEADQARRDAAMMTLQAEVAALRAANDEDWLTEARVEAVREVVHDVLADADTRASLQDSGLTAGWDNGFFMASTDGNFRLNLTGTVQVRYVYNHQEESPEDDSRSGFENRLTTLRFYGHMFDPSWKYVIHGNFDVNDGDFQLFDAAITKVLDNGWSLQAGKFKLPYDREQLMSYNNQLAVDRSLIAAAFGVGRSQGAQAVYQGDAIRLAGAVSDGLGSIVGTSAPALAYDTEWAATGRADFLVSGDWKQFADFTAWPGTDTGLLLGVAVHWQSDEYGTSAHDDETEVLRWLADATLECGTVNVYLAVHGNHTTSKGATPNRDQYGVVAHAGWLFDAEAWELYGRYEWAESDSAEANLNIATVGIVRHFHRQQLKWTTDVGYALDPVAAQYASTVKGWRVDTPNEDGQYVLRTQLQLVF